MGTITIIEYNTLGTSARRDADIADLTSVIATTVDTSTITTVKSIVLNEETRLVRIASPEKHRVSTKDYLVTTKYDTIEAGTKEDFGVEENLTLYYRLDA